MDRLDMPHGRKHEPPPPAYPDLPNSLHAQEFELVDLGNPEPPSLSRASTAPSITPYLGLRARLSQVWLNRWTVLLLLVLLRVVICLQGLDESIDDARVKALAACTKVEDVASSMSSMPHYLSRGVNELAASGVESAVRAMAESLQLAITVVEGLVLFSVGAMTDAYAGLAAALIEGSLGTADEAIARFAEAANRTVGAIADGLEADAGSLQGDIDTLVKQAEEKIFGAKLPSVPEVDLSSTLEKLRTLDIDTSRLAGDVQRLAGDGAPTFDGVRNATERAITAPFDALRKGINDSFSAFTFDRASFPLADKKRLTFCSDNDDLERFFEGMHDSVATGRAALVGTLSGLALVAMAPVAWLEILRWRRARSNARLANREEYDPLDVVYLSSRALSATWGMSLGARFFGAGRRQVLARWCVAYATSLPALLVLSLALAGFASCLCRLAVLRTVGARVPALAERVGDFAGDVVGNLREASGRWASEGNAVIDGLNERVNEGLRRMVGEGTAAVDDALGTFAREMQRGVEGAFGATVLRNATGAAVGNLSGLRTDAVRRGLDWLLDQAVVSVPRFSDAAFSLGAEESITGDGEMTTFLASASSATTDEVSGAARAVIERLERGIVVEALVATALLMMYVVVVLVGVVRVLVKSGRGGGTRGEGAGGCARMPRLDGGGAPGRGGLGVVYEGPGGFYAGDGVGGDEKYVARVGGGRARRVVAHQRQSSYGDIGETGKF